jgi:hypothetical protein
MDCKRDSGTTSVDLQRFDAAATQEALDLKSFKVGRCVLLDWKMIGNCEKRSMEKSDSLWDQYLIIEESEELIDVFITEESISNVWCIARE